MTRPAGMLLPGNMCDARLWPDQVRDALPGAIDADLTLDDSIAAMAARALAAVEGPLLAVGFSLGAIVATEMWVQAPHRVRGLILIGYNAAADVPERAAHRPFQQAEVRAGGLERVLVEELKPNYLAAARRGDTALLARIRDMGLGLGGEVFVRQSEALRLRADRRSSLAKMRIPVLFSCGTEDALCPSDWHRQWHLAVPGSRLELVAGAGHMLPLEAPESLARMIGQWIGGKELL